MSERVYIGDHVHGKGRRERTYKVHRAADGFLHLYRTTSVDARDGLPTSIDRIVTNCTEIDQLAGFLTRKRKRRKKNKLKQLSILDAQTPEQHDD